MVLVLLCAAAAPARAALPAAPAAPAPELQLFDWLQGVLVHLGLLVTMPAPEEPGEPGPVSPQDACGADPNGAPCPDNEDS